jgi:hypothetical protein
MSPRTPEKPPASKPSRQKQAAAQRALAAAARDREQRRRRWLTVVAPVGVVVLVLVALVAVKLTSNSGAPKSGAPARAAADAVITKVTNVPAATADAIGAGAVQALPKAIADPLTADGKARVLYVGGEFCPYCAAERWALTIALSRFGTFTGLGQTTSSPNDRPASIATLTYHGATYTSDLVSFTGAELQSNEVVNGQYATLDTLAPADAQRFERYGGGAYPFVDIGGKYTVKGASYDPGVLQGKTHEQIAAALADPGSATARAVVGTANVLTAAICATTGERPAAVCSAPGVTAARARLGNAG